MNFLDSLFDKIPIIRDMDKKKRILLVGFAVFAVISILGILIEAIVGASGIIAVTHLYYNQQIRNSQSNCVLTFRM